MDDVLGYRGRHVVVTGAASGMGLATTRLLLDLGASVTALDRQPLPDDLAGAAGAAGLRTVPVDLLDRAAIDAAVDAIADPVDAVISCAGLPGPPFADVDVVTVNFLAARHLIERLVPRMPAGSAVACVASVGGLGWQGGLAKVRGLLETTSVEAGQAWCVEHARRVAAPGSYVFSKQVLSAWTAWRSHGLFRDHGVRLNCTSPGLTDTAMIEAFHDSLGREVVGGAVGAVGRYSTAEEQALPLAFLCSPRATYLVGTNLFVDGGYVAALETGQHAYSAT